MNKLNKFFLYALSGCLISFTACNDDEVVTPVEETPTHISDFEDLSFPEGEDVYYGQDKAGLNVGENDWGYTQYVTDFTSGQVVYTAYYYEQDADNYYYSGVTVSRLTDNTLQGLEGRDIAMPGEGAEGSEVYGIYNGNAPFTFEYEAGANPQSIQITNNAYAYSSMLQGDQFSKRFGGVDGDDPDYFKLTIIGHDEEDNETGRVDFYLADYRFDDNSEDYIVDSWEEVDLMSLGTVHKISFAFESTDEGEWGMNTPAYFAFDNLVTQPAETTEE